MLTREDPCIGHLCVNLAGKRSVAPSEVTEVTSLKSIPIFVFNWLAMLVTCLNLLVILLSAFSPLWALFTSAVSLDD